MNADQTRDNGSPRSHALRGNVFFDALRRHRRRLVGATRRTRSVPKLRPDAERRNEDSCLIRVPLHLSAAVLFFLAPALAAELESRQLTHYVPQDALEAAVRKEGWTEVPLAVKGGVRKGDVVRVWAGGSIDRGDGEQPGQNAGGPHGIDPKALGTEKPNFALSAQSAYAFALLVKTDGVGPAACQPPGRPMEIKLTKDGE